MFRCIGRVTAVVGAFALAVALAFAPAAAAQVEPYGYDDYGGFRNILPPGQNGLDDLTQAAQFKAAGTYPPHSNDQLGMYSNLTTAVPITEAQIPQFYKDATFGVPAGDLASSESPEPGVTIERDSGFGVPHIYGDTRAELMSGIGYATAEDRLFFIDVLRHSGQGDLAQFAGGSNVAMDEDVWSNEPYTQQDLVNQVNWAASSSPDGPQILSDATNYVDGINAFIAKAESPLGALTMMPAEYAAIGQPQGPAPFTVEDLVSIATLVGGIFGNGGGQQLSNAVLYENMEQKFGPEHYTVAGSPELNAQPATKKKKKRKHKKHKGSRSRKKAADIAVASAARAHKPPKSGTRHAGKAGLGAGKISKDDSGFATFMSFDDPNDPEAPTTVHGKSFPYQTLPRPSKAVQKTIALPDPGSVSYVNPVTAGAVPAGESGQATTGSRIRPSSSGVAGMAESAGQGLLQFPRSMSNALLVSAADSASCHPLAVMGPQVSYFSPEILMEEDIHGPGIDAEGAAFPGVNLYVELGHGPDYAWSATSAGQNIIDTFAAPLCNPSGGTVSMDSDYYVLNDGDCRDPGPARCRGAAVRAADHRPSKRPDARYRGQRVAGVGGERRPPDQPGAGGWVPSLRRLRPDRRGADHGRLVAAARERRVRPHAGLGSARAGRERFSDQRPARTRRVRRPPGLRVRRRLLRHRPEGPALGPGRQSRRAAEPRVLRRRIAGQLPRGARVLA